MLGILEIASYICGRYRRDYGAQIDEMKLHKLLYFTQRESIVQTGSPITADAFEAWKYGPVSPDVHKYFDQGKIFNKEIEAIDPVYTEVLDTVFNLYAQKNAWSLSTLSHGELSWQRARGGVASTQPCTAKLRIEDIREDANRIRLRRFLMS